MSSENPHRSSTTSPGSSPPRPRPPPPSPSSPPSHQEEEETPQPHQQEYPKLLEEIDEEFKNVLTLSLQEHQTPPSSPPQEHQNPQEQEQDPFKLLQIANDCALLLSMAVQEQKALLGKASPGFENPQMNLPYLLRCPLPPGFDCESTAPSDLPDLLNCPRPSGFNLISAAPSETPDRRNCPLPLDFNCEFTDPPESGYFGSDDESIAAENAALDAFYASRATQQHHCTSNADRPFQIREPVLPSAAAATSTKESLDESLPLKGPMLFEESETDEKEDDEMKILFQCSETKEQDDITTLKYLSSYRSDGGLYSFRHDFEDIASTSSAAPGHQWFANSLIAYINARLPKGENHVSEMQLRLKLSRLWTEFLKMLGKYGQNPKLYQHLSRPENEREMFHLLKRVWTQKGPGDVVQEAAVNVVDLGANAKQLTDVHGIVKPVPNDTIPGINADQGPDNVVPEAAANVIDVLPESIDVHVEKAMESVHHQALNIDPELMHNRPDLSVDREGNVQAEANTKQEAEGETKDGQGNERYRLITVLFDSLY